LKKGIKLKKMSAEGFTPLGVIKEYLKYLQALGYSEIPALPEFSSLLGRPKAVPGDSWTDLMEKIVSCQDCSLFRIRKQPVLDRSGEGKKLMLLGDYPDREDDYYGRPFSGAIKDTLQKMLLSIGLRKEDFYVTLAVKCKPPAGKAPDEESLLACKKYLLKEIKLLKPRLILAFGFLPPKVFLDSPISLTSLRGRPFQYKETMIIFTYHPAYMFKNPSVKRLIWEDLKTFKKLYEDLF
jgi:DNA polymerase